MRVGSIFPVKIPKNGPFWVKKQLSAVSRELSEAENAGFPTAEI
jgi:hypothetical protein